MLDHANYNEALLAMLHAVEARIEAPASCEIAWEPDPDLLRDILLERKLDREIERRAAPLPQPRIPDARYGKHILYRDWETYSEVNIKQGGALYYAAHPTTLPLLVCYAIDDGPVQSYRPTSGEPIPEIFFTAARDPDWLVAAHNNLFDSAVEIHQAAPRFNWPLVPIERQVCTMALAQSHSYPGALEKIADRLKLAIRKDKAGKKLMQRITRPQRRPDGTWGYIEPTPEEWECFIEYAKTDAVLVRELLRYFKPLPEIEQRLYQLDHKINHRGPYIDAPLAIATHELVKVEKASINARLHEITGGAVTAFTKIEDIRAFVNAHGHDMANLDKRAVTAVLHAIPTRSCARCWNCGRPVPIPQRPSMTPCSSASILISACADSCVFMAPSPGGGPAPNLTFTISPARTPRPRKPRSRQSGPATSNRCVNLARRWM